MRGKNRVPLSPSAKATIKSMLKYTMTPKWLKVTPVARQRLLSQRRRIREKESFAFVRLAAGGCADEAIENAESALTAVALLAVEPLTWTTGLQDIAPKAGAEAVSCSTNTLQDFLCVSGSRHQEVHRMFLSGAQVGLRDSAKFLQSLASAATIAHTYAASIERHGAEKTAMVLVALSCKFWGMRLPNWKKLAEHLGLAPAEYIRLECDIVRNIKFDGNFAGLPAFAEGHDVF
jgi:hypothetical protein